MSTDIIYVTHAGAVIPDKDIDLSSDFSSKILEFKATTIASVQFCWNGLVGQDDATKIQFWISNVRDVSKFVCFPESEISINSLVADGLESHMYLFSNGVVSFRYGQVRFISGAASAGTAQIIAVGKRGGGGL